MSIEWNNTMLKTTTNSNTRKLEFINEVFHYSDRQHNLPKMMQQKPKYYGKDVSDVEMYQFLIQQFQHKDRIEQLKELYEWSERPMRVGLHIREGNGEQGDFMEKNRGITGISEMQWISNVASLIHNFTLSASNDNKSHATASKLPPLIFLATDSSNVTDLVNRLQQRLNDAAAASESDTIVPQVVTAMNQPRVPGGKGVSFQYQFQTKELCIDSWIAQFIDQILLGESDVVLAGQYSSFTQTIPLSLQFEKTAKGESIDDNNNNMTGLVCNVGTHATILECFDNLEDWMRKKSRIPLFGDPDGPKQAYKNLIMMPIHSLMLRNKLQKKLRGLPVEITSLI
jgi:hypothetical protein